MSYYCITCDITKEYKLTNFYFYLSSCLFLTWYLVFYLNRHVEQTNLTYILSFHCCISIFISTNSYIPIFNVVQYKDNFLLSILLTHKSGRTVNANIKNGYPLSNLQKHLVTRTWLFLRTYVNARTYLPTCLPSVYPDREFK